MINTYQSGVLNGAAWQDLQADIDPRAGDEANRNRFVDGLMRTLREAGGVYYILETAYIDRDFVRAYSSFFHRTHRPYPKHCSRLHVFTEDLTALESLSPAELAVELEKRAKTTYVGCVVLRPLENTPVSWALVSAPSFENDSTDILVRSDYTIHLLGAELVLTGIPVTEQDGRTGSCAQASIWAAARHMHNRRGDPWHSVVDITNAALDPTDADIATSLPPGSAKLTRDAMVRAMKAIGLHPQVYTKEDEWFEKPHRIIARYLDSGIPVIVGMERPEKNSVNEHAVLAVGIEGHRMPKSTDRKEGDNPEAAEPDATGLSLGPTTSDFFTHLIVNDDQGGPYRRLAVQATDRVPESYDWCLDDDVTFIMPTLPDTVFVRAERAETIARLQIARVISEREDLIRSSDDEPEEALGVDPDFYGSAGNAAENLVARTYLTQGWKYAHRMLRNTAPDRLKSQLMRLNLPRYVWVTEFSLPEDVVERAPCVRRVRAHVVVDPTNGPHWDSAIITHLPGLLATTGYDPDAPAANPELIVFVMTDDRTYFPKVRGWPDYSPCENAA